MQTITGDIGRRLRDALAETAVSVVQHLPDADIVKAAQRVTSNTENPILQAHHRLNKSLPFDATADVRLAPLHSCLSAYSNAQATDAKDKAMVSLRQSLMALVEDDFNLLSGIGSLGRFGDDTSECPCRHGAAVHWQRHLQAATRRLPGFPLLP